MPSKYDFSSLDNQLAKLEKELAKFNDSFSETTSSIAKTKFNDREYGNQALSRKVSRIVDDAKNRISSAYNNYVNGMRRETRDSINRINKEANSASQYCDELNGLLNDLNVFNQYYAQGKYQEVISTDFNAEPYPLEIAEYITLIKLESYDAICKKELGNVSLEGFRTFKAYYSSCKRSKASKHLAKAGTLLFSASFALSSISGCPYDVLIDGLKGYKDIPEDQKEEYCQQYSYLYSKAVVAFNDLSNKAFLEFDYNKVKSFLNESEFFSVEDISNDFFKDGKSTPEKLFEYACQYGKTVPIETMRILFDDTKTLSRGTMSEKYLGFWLRRYDEYGFDFIKQVIDNQEDRFVSTDLISKTLPNEGSFVKKTGSLMNDLVLDYQAYLESNHNNIPLMKFCQASVLWSDLVKKVSVQYDQQEMSKMSKAVELLDGLSYSMIVKYQKYCNCFDPNLIASLNIVLDESSNRLFGKPYKKDLQKAENSSVDVDSITVKLVSVQLKKKKKKAAIIWISIIVALATIAVLLFFLFNKPSHVHSYSEFWESDSLCHWHKCSCGATTNAENHSFGDWTVVKESTNTTEGEKGRSCSICGYYETAAITILLPDHITHSFGTSWSKNENGHWHECSCGEKADEAEHTFSAWTTIKEATTDIEGEKTRLCTVCGFSEKTTIPRLNHIHSYGTLWISNENKHWHECECGEKTEETNHTFDTWTTVKEPTNSAEGQKKHSCSVCGYTETASIPKLNHSHSYGTTWMSNDSSHWHQCSCGEKTALSNHTYGNWETIKAATSSTSGEKRRSCNVCGYSETTTIPVIEHTHSFGSTWLTNENQHWHVCSCGEKSNIEVHKYGSWTIVTASTCTSVGAKTATCSVCGYKKTESIPANGHSLTKIAAVAPTCTSPGQTEGSYCSVCGIVVSGQESINALGHDFVDTITPPTVTTDGYTTHTCSRCGYTYKDSATDATGSTGLAYEDNGQGLCWITGIGSCTDKDIIVPSSINGSKVYAITANAFTNQTSITSITLPETLEVIGKRAFYGCTNLNSINLPRNLKNIQTDAFIFSGLESVVFDSTDLFIIGDGNLFSGCHLKSIVFNCPEVPESICKDCTSLTAVTINYGSRSIGAYAFSGCTNLKSVTISTNVKSIGREAFPEYINITYLGTIAQWNSIQTNSWWAGFLPTYKIYCTDGIIDGINGVSYY